MCDALHQCGYLTCGGPTNSRVLPAVGQYELDRLQGDATVIWPRKSALHKYPYVFASITPSSYLLHEKQSSGRLATKVIFMGIKGIYRELGPGRRVSLSKLAADNLTKIEKPLRLAIDIAIWQFQTQAARGGTNPAIRTLFYRLVRLLGTPIQPIFVFDGPKKPGFKRNKRSGRVDGVATAQAKQLIQLFDFDYHDAPGEAEAECALLQARGLVDAVLSEDVDTIMFGCTKTLRNWSAEGGSSKSPTHVSLYDIHEEDLASLGLDREGMVLVALMSGGDYIPEGIPGCGIKVACEAARAGFGKSICRIKASDSESLQNWRESLINQLQTNEKGYFRTKHKSLAIPDDFPNLDILRLYTHPVVSPDSRLEVLRQTLERPRRPNVKELREFTRNTFGWDFRAGAIKFIRVLSQALLVHNLCQGHPNAGRHIKRISGRRKHLCTDQTSEIRVAFVPNDVVPIDLSNEVEEDVDYSRTGLALNSDDEIDTASDSRPMASKAYDVTKLDLAWVLEVLARTSAPKEFQAWQESETAKTGRKPSAKRQRGHRSKSKKPGNTTPGPLDRFYRATKAPATTEEAQKSPEKEPFDMRLAPHSTTHSSHPSHSTARQISKQTLVSATSCQTRRLGPEILGSSPNAPRPSQTAHRSKAILISSSPAPKASPLLSSPFTRPWCRSPRTLSCAEDTLDLTASPLSSRSSARKMLASGTCEIAEQLPKNSTTIDSFNNHGKAVFARSVRDSMEFPPAYPLPSCREANTSQHNSWSEAGEPGEDANHKCRRDIDLDGDSSDLEPLPSIMCQPPYSHHRQFQSIVRVGSRMGTRTLDSRIEAKRWSDVSVIDLVD